MKSNVTFERLRRSVLRIADHPPVVGKEAALAACVAEIEERHAQGGLDLVQRCRLLSLLGAEAPAAPG